MHLFYLLTRIIHEPNQGVMRFISLLCFCTLIIASCTKLESNVSLQNKWKLKGFVLPAGLVVPAAPIDCDKCYRLEFGSGRKLEGRTSTNWFNGVYRNTDRSLMLDSIIITKITERDDGYEYTDLLFEVKEYNIKGEELHLYGSDKERHLLYTLEEK